MIRLLFHCVLLALSGGLLLAAPVRVLFIGNSYTYYHSTPGMVQELARAAGQELEFRAFTRGGSTLMEMETHPELRGLLNEKWDYIVLQEHSTLGFSSWNGELSVNDPSHFLQAARLLAQRAKGAKLVLYATWARKQHPEFQPHLDFAYAAASREINATVAPAGRAWAAIREQQPGLELFAKDGSHPSPAGSYLNACVLMRTLVARPCTGLPGTLRTVPLNTRGHREEARGEVEVINLKPETAALLQRAADEAVPDSGTLGPWPHPQLSSGRRPKPDDLSGRWRGRVFFYGTPAGFELELKPDGDKCTGVWRLNADNGAWSSSRRLTTCELTDLGFTFTVTDPAGVATENHVVAFNGRELSAVASLNYRTAMRRSAGTWTAKAETTRSSR